MFGLAQLYQLRGRVGRSKLRAYALFTLPAQQKITGQAERRLKVLQSLENLGADSNWHRTIWIFAVQAICSAKNSPAISSEVGFELYQSMLEEAILSLKAGISEPVADRWSPQITLGMPVLPFRRTMWRTCRSGCRSIAVLLILTPTMKSKTSAPSCGIVSARCRTKSVTFFKIAAIKAYCRRANIEKVDAGPKGAVISFRDNSFAHPDKLVYFIRQHGQAAKVRPDMKVVFLQEWKTPDERIEAHDDHSARSRQSGRRTQSCLIFREKENEIFDRWSLKSLGLHRSHYHADAHDERQERHPRADRQTSTTCSSRARAR